VLPLLALGFILAAWWTMAAGEGRVNQLDLSRWGTDLDIPERLAIDRYIAQHFRPYIWAAVGLDSVAFAALCWAGKRGPMRALGVTVSVVWVASAGWHALNWLVTWFFAA
jgi:hypothetical protein